MLIILESYHLNLTTTVWNDYIQWWARHFCVCTESKSNTCTYTMGRGSYKGSIYSKFITLFSLYFSCTCTMDNQTTTSYPKILILRLSKFSLKWSVKLQMVYVKEKNCSYPNNSLQRKPFFSYSSPAQTIIFSRKENCLIKNSHFLMGFLKGKLSV